MDVFFWRPTTPTPLRNVTHFFRLYEAHEALLILLAIRLSVVYKRIKVHLGQGQNLIVSIQIYLKYKYCTLTKMLDFVYLVSMISKYQKYFKLSRFFTFFTEKRHRRQPPPPTLISLPTFRRRPFPRNVVFRSCHFRW